MKQVGEMPAKFRQLARTKFVSLTSRQAMPVSSARRAVALLVGGRRDLISLIMVGNRIEGPWGCEIQTLWWPWHAIQQHHVLFIECFLNGRTRCLPTVCRSLQMRWLKTVQSQSRRPVGGWGVGEVLWVCPVFRVVAGSPIGAWPVCTARLMGSAPLNSEPDGMSDKLSISPPVAFGYTCAKFFCSVFAVEIGGGIGQRHIPLFRHGR